MISTYYRKAVPLFIRKVIKNIWKFKPWRLVFLPLFPAIVAIGALRRLKKKSSHISRILVINLAAIGDNLMATPAIRVLNEKFPKAQITVMTGNSSSPGAYINNPRVANTLRLKQFEAGSVKYVFKKKANKSFDLYKAFTCYPTPVFKLLMARYDLGVNFCAFEGGANFGNLLMYLCGIPIRLGAFGSYTKLLTESKDSKEFKDKCWVDIYLSIVEAVTGKSDARNREFYLSGDDELFADKFLKKEGICPKDLLIGVHPGGNLFVNSRRWPLERFAAVLNKLSARYAFKVLILGSRDEEELVNKLKDSLKIDSITIIGLKLNEVAALLKRTTILLANDSAILHLADATMTPYIISIFGPTDPKRSCPRNERNIYISSKIECAPCIELDAGDESKRCTKEDKNECLKQISKEEVLNILESVFRQ